MPVLEFESSVLESCFQCVLEAACPGGGGGVVRLGAARTGRQGRKAPNTRGFCEGLRLGWIVSR